MTGPRALTPVRADVLGVVTARPSLASSQAVCSRCARPIRPVPGLEWWIEAMLARGSRLYCSPECTVQAQRELVGRAEDVPRG